MHTNIAAVTGVIAALSTLANGQVPFPAITPEYPLYGEMDRAMDAQLTAGRYRATLLPHGWLPRTCFNGWGLTDFHGADFDVYRVTFPDCEEPTIVCRHRNSPASPQVIFEVNRRRDSHAARSTQLTSSHVVTWKDERPHAPVGR